MWGKGKPAYFGYMWTGFEYRLSDYWTSNLHIEDVLEMLKNNNFVKVGKSLGVSDNAVRAFLLRNNINPKTLQVIEVMNSDVW